MEEVNDRNRLKALFGNSTSRLLLGVWLLVKGSAFTVKSVAELIAVPEDALEAKLQSLAGMGLIFVTMDNTGTRTIEFLPAPNPETQKLVEEFFQSRKSDFELVEVKLRSHIYKKLIDTTL